jgi:hypothetical protein
MDNHRHDTTSKSVPGIHEPANDDGVLHSEADNSMREILPTRLWIGNAAGHDVRLDGLLQ